jgi:hypothetical protein
MLKLCVTHREESCMVAFFLFLNRYVRRKAVQVSDATVGWTADKPCNVKETQSGSMKLKIQTLMQVQKLAALAQDITDGDHYIHTY